MSLTMLCCFGGSGCSAGSSGDGWREQDSARRKAIKLFNGKNLDGLGTFLKTKGLNNDPEKVFQVENGIIHISGSEFGCIITKKEFSNYYLRAEFKWGEGIHDPRAGKARDSGILFQVVGPNNV